MKIIGLIILCLIGSLGVFVTWKVSNFFLSRRDFYINSPYKILTIKIGWCISTFITVLALGSKLLKGLFW
jgi:hypothetical protein